MTRDGGAGDLELLLVDGDNLLYALRGRRDEGGTAWLLPRLARWRPEGLRIVVVLDGHPAPGEPMRQRALGIDVRHAGSRSADDAIVELLRTLPYAERSHAAVVTRDRGLRERVSLVRAQTRTPDWLLRGLQAAQRTAIHRSGGSGPVPDSGAVGRGPGVEGAPPVGIGRGRATGTSARRSSADDSVEAESWRPGRGATRKRGNPRRGAKPGRPR